MNMYMRKQILAGVFATDCLMLLYSPQQLCMANLCSLHTTESTSITLN